MEILHVVESLASEGGGLPAAVKTLMLLQQENGYSVACAETVGNAAATSKQDLCGISLGRSVSKLATLCLAVFRGRYQVVHIHGLWDVFYPLICLACIFGDVKYVVTTHGQLLSTILRADSGVKRLKKRVYQACVGQWILFGASRIHVSSENELREFSCSRRVSRKTCFIPHIIDPVFFRTIANTAGSSSVTDSVSKDILFVGRLDRRKGILDLIDGFIAAQLPAPWRLRIVGPDGDEAFMKELIAKIESSTVVGRILLEQPVYGDARADLYLSCYIFCLPSYSEAPGLVNIEAALLGRPVLTTPNTGLFMLDAEGGMLCETGGASIASALEAIGRWSGEEYTARSIRIRSWATRDYSLAAIVPKWQKFYALTDTLS